MADFWRGVAQGFAPAYQASLSRREKMEAILAQQKREDDRQKILDKRYETERAEGRADKQAALALTAKMEARKQEQARETLMAKLGATSPEVRREALMSVGGVPMKGLAPGYEARTLEEATPEEFKGLDRGALAGASVRAEAQQTLANELAEEERKRDEAQAAATLAHERRLIPTPVDYAGKLKYEGDLSKLQTRPSGTPTAPTAHKRVEDLIKVIDDPTTLPADRKTAQKVLDTLKPPAAGRAPTTIEKREEYTRTLKDPNASVEDKAFAQELLAQMGGDTTEVYGAEGQLLFRTGKASTGAQKDPQPSSLSNALLDIRELQRGFNPDKPSVGWIATAKNAIGDKVLPQVGVTAFSDPQRVAYRQAVKEFKVAYVKALNAPDSRLSDMDRRMLEPLAPNENDSPFEFQVKLNTVERKVRLHQKFNTAFAGKKDPVWTMGLREVLDARKVSPVTGKAVINDELAAFALQESHGLKGVSQPQWMENIQALYDKKAIDEDELRFYLKSVLGR